MTVVIGMMDALLTRWLEMSQKSPHPDPLGDVETETTS
jgi:hypothetical protein